MLDGRQHFEDIAYRGFQGIEPAVGIAEPLTDFLNPLVRGPDRRESGDQNRYHDRQRNLEKWPVYDALNAKAPALRIAATRYKDSAPGLPVSSSIANGAVAR